MADFTVGSTHLSGTAGQAVVGSASSGGSGLSNGYWPGDGSAQPPCCGQYTGGFSGNANCSTDGKRNLADITILIDHVYISKLPLCCPEEGNISGDLEGKVMSNSTITTIKCNRCDGSGKCNVCNGSGKQ